MIYLLVVFGVFLCSASQLLLKKSAGIEHGSAIKEFLNWRILFAYGIMFSTLVINIFAMSKGVQLKEMPILEALGYVFVPVLSFFFLRESLNIRSITSISLIIIGVIIFYV